ncbi:MAG: hypothetical protein AB8B73_16085 [Ekhidna sp.]
MEDKKKSNSKETKAERELRRKAYCDALYYCRQEATERRELLQDIIYLKKLIKSENIFSLKTLNSKNKLLNFQFNCFTSPIPKIREHHQMLSDFYNQTLKHSA